MQKHQVHHTMLHTIGIERSCRVRSATNSLSDLGILLSLSRHCTIWFINNTIRETTIYLNFIWVHTCCTDVGQAHSQFPAVKSECDYKEVSGIWYVTLSSNPFCQIAHRIYYLSNMMLQNEPIHEIGNYFVFLSCNPIAFALGVMTVQHLRHCLKLMIQADPSCSSTYRILLDVRLWHVSTGQVVVVVPDVTAWHLVKMELSKTNDTGIWPVGSILSIQ